MNSSLTRKMKRRTIIMVSKGEDERNFMLGGTINWQHKYEESERSKVKWCHGGMKRELMVLEWV